MPGQDPKVLVTLVDESGVEKYVSVEDNWLTERGLTEGSLVAGRFDNTEMTERYLKGITLQEKTHILY